MEKKYTKPKRTEEYVLSSFVESIDDDDGARLEVIIGWGRDLGYEGNKLAAFVRKSILMLLNLGAYPVPGPYESATPWKRMTEFGNEPKQVADNIVNHWLKNGDPEPLLSLWLHRPELQDYPKNPSRSEVS